MSTVNGMVRVCNKIEQYIVELSKSEKNIQIEIKENKKNKRSVFVSKILFNHTHTHSDGRINRFAIVSRTIASRSV